MITGEIYVITIAVVIFTFILIAVIPTLILKNLIYPEQEKK